MSIWDILGMDATTDILAIKKAYAAKSKMYHPEEHPEEFKQLRSAYKEAVKYAKNHDSNENHSGEEKNVENIQDSKYISFEFGKSESHKVMGKSENVVSQNSQQEENQKEVYQKERPKTLYERLHPEESRGGFHERRHSGERPKSLYERLHPEEKREMLNQQVHTKEKKKSQAQQHILPEKDDKTERKDTSHSGEFNYNEIINEKMLEKFLGELKVIFQNPFIKNNIRFWEYYINNNWYGELFHNDYVIERFIDEMCKYSDWFAYTLKALEEMLNKNTRMKISFDRVRQRKEKIRAVTTEYQRNVNEFIMAKVEEGGFKKMLDNDDSIKCYLEIYFKLVEEKKIRLDR